MLKRAVGLFIVMILVLAGTVFLSGCGGEQKDVNEVRLGFFPNLTHAAALVGLEKNLFQQELGAEITLKTHHFDAGPALMEALSAGEIDIAYVGPVPAITNYLRGAGVVILAGAYEGGGTLVAGGDAGIGSAADLAGKRVAIPQLGNTQDISLRHILQVNGLKDKLKGGAVEIIQVPPADTLTLMVQKQVDAALVPEPWGVLMEQKAGAKVVLDWKQVWRDGRYPTTVLAARKEFLERNPQLVEKVVKAHIKAVEAAKANPEEARMLVKRAIKNLVNKEIPDDVLAKALERGQVTAEIDGEVLRDFARLSYEAGYLKEEPNLEGLVNLQYLKAQQ